MRGFAVFAVMLILQAPQQGSLIDAARRNGGKVMASFNVNAPKPKFDTVATASDLIVRGAVRRVATRLSDDGEFVLTEFEIIPIKVYKGNSGNTAKTPGPTKPLLVQRPGGTVMIDGLEVTIHANAFPEKESLHEGEDVFLFLSRDANTSVFDFTGGPRGAYRIADGRVTAMTRSTAAERGEEPQSLEAFETRVMGLIRK